MGGGGASTTSESGLPDWARPAVESSLNKAVATEGAGGFSHVQDLTPEQLDAFGRRKELGQRGGVLDQIASDSYGATQAYRDAASGTGLFGADAIGQQAKALEGTIGQAQKAQLGGLQGQAAQRGALGSARSQASIDQALTKTGADIASRELDARRQASLAGAGGTLGAGQNLQNQFLTGVGQTEDVGSALQQQAQNEGDAAYQGLQRLFGLYGSPALGQKQVSTQRGK